MLDEIDETDLKRAVADLVNIAFSDSHVKVDATVLEDCLRTDFGVTGRLPSTSECDEIVTGGDDGELNEELEDDFPQTCEFLQTYWE